MRQLTLVLICCLTTTTTTLRGQAADVITLANVGEPSAISAAEPRRDAFSALQAARYLDTASLDWQHRQGCVTCHTNMAYLMARPALQATLADSGEVRAFFEQYILKRWAKGAEAVRRPYNAVVLAAGLAFHDAQTTGELSPVTRRALDLMWETQDEHGAWRWLKCGWAPMEIDDHYGVTLAVLAAGVAPGGYADSGRAQAGLAKARSYLKAHPAPSLHHRIMLAWASFRVADLMTPAKREQVLREMFDQQLDDGGWSTPAMLADWATFKRKDGKPHDVQTADAYATGLALVLAREMGVPSEDPRVRRGVAWLKANQRISGKWFTRSPSKDSKHYFTNVGSAFAVLGLQASGELAGWPFGERETGATVR